MSSDSRAYMPAGIPRVELGLDRMTDGDFVRPPRSEALSQDSL